MREEILQLSEWNHLRGITPLVFCCRKILPILPLIWCLAIYYFCPRGNCLVTYADRPTISLTGGDLRKFTAVLWCVPQNCWRLRTVWNGQLGPKFTHWSICFKNLSQTFWLLPGAIVQRCGSHVNGTTKAIVLFPVFVLQLLPCVIRCVHTSGQSEWETPWCG